MEKGKDEAGQRILELLDNRLSRMDQEMIDVNQSITELEAEVKSLVKANDKKLAGERLLLMKGRKNLIMKKEAIKLFLTKVRGEVEKFVLHKDMEKMVGQLATLIDPNAPDAQERISLLDELVSSQIEQKATDEAVKSALMRDEDARSKEEASIPYIIEKEDESTASKASQSIQKDKQNTKNPYPMFD
eukprot:TRINITY_DN3516_c0_g2_i1.p1 TRINITY_DN3516_c0_g2~~TRINITY_DN3516_c0_g2_i1.p1  ORF type:complete len:188 (+),score=36.78 TRINITY_DN3516_c0_g2_i1:155-718(+)